MFCYLIIKGSGLKTLDVSLWMKMSSNLVSLTLSNNTDIDKNSIVELLKTNSLIQRLKYLHLSNLNASSANLPLDRIISDATPLSNSGNLTFTTTTTKTPTINLELIDISFNNFADDLNKFLFNQVNLRNLVEFRARSNRFSRCYERLRMGERETLLGSLQVLDISYNNLNDSACFLAIKPLVSLRTLDLNHNHLSLNTTTTTTTTSNNKDSYKDSNKESNKELFANKLNLTYIDLSYNSLTNAIFYFNKNHTKIDKFDLSNNQIRTFRLLSQTALKDKTTTTTNGKKGGGGKEEEMNEEEDDYDAEEYNVHLGDDDEESDDDETLLETGNRNKDGEEDDDDRFLIIEDLDLSSNKLNPTIHLQNMMQSIKNILYLDLSNNPIEQVIGMSLGAIVLENKLMSGNGSITTVNSVSQGENEILCIDVLNLSNCKLKRIPNLQHVCINKIDLKSNLLSGNAHLIVSNYTLYFMDYLNLQSNNLTYIEFFISGMKFKQDSYKIQNSPVNYFYGRTNSSGEINHTYVDTKDNRNFVCDCKLVRTLEELNGIKLINECFEKQQDLRIQCRNAKTAQEVRNLNQKLRTLFVITCFVLIILSVLIIYYMCSDFLRKMRPINQIRSNFSRLLVYLKLKSKYDTSMRDSNAHNNNIGVQYQKLVNDQVSQIDIHT